MSRATIVIVEDDFLIAEDLRGMCEEFGASVLGMAHAADEAFAVIEKAKPQYVLMDVRLGGKRDGVDIAQQVYDAMPETKLIFITGSNEPPTIERIKQDHPFRILIKPISPRELSEAITS
ncbi:response regulator [Roseicyclus sp. F158]|uniref:Response regulator n=1 Tax=Tropicimonas omnivorans TaxID=3075590 RepID=A0ABU3DKA9_9RHOB|nr:response regulator [Roseicyclus sp. F158]MDT0684154.1 response regulator [Roseicyclus sp. F158]